MFVLDFWTKVPVSDSVADDRFLHDITAYFFGAGEGPFEPRSEQLVGPSGFRRRASGVGLCASGAGGGSSEPPLPSNYSLLLPLTPPSHPQTARTILLLLFPLILLSREKSSRN